MKTTLRLAANACLVTAASGLLCSRMTALQAQDGDAAAGQPSTNAQVLQAQGYAPVTRASSVPEEPEQESAVQKELKKLARKNNRDFPSMNINDAPNTQGPAPSQQATEPRPAGAGMIKPAPTAPAPKPNWFERTFHVGRGKRKPAPVAENPPPTSSRAPAYRMTNPTVAGRPAAPVNRAPMASAPRYQAPPSAATPSFTPPPVAAAPAATVQPAQPQLREPAPLAPSPAARELTSKSPSPVARSSRPKGGSQPLLDESGMGDDAESLDLDDGASQVAEQAPQTAANGSGDKATSDSPYSGLKIAPNEEERQASGRLQALPSDEVTEIEAPDQGVNTATKSVVDELAIPVEKPVESKPAATKPKIGLAPVDDEDDDEDDEDEDEDDAELSLSSDKPGDKLHKLPEPAVLKAERVLEKMANPAPGSPSAGAAATAAPASTAEPVAAAASGDPVATANATPAASAAVTATPFCGFKGLCPVALKDSRKLIDAQPTIVSTYKGKTFAFSSVEAKAAFDENPQKYAPAGAGADVVRLTAGEKDVEGTLEHAAWYRGRLYLFSTSETRHEFAETPSKFVIED